MLANENEPVESVGQWAALIEAGGKVASGALARKGQASALKAQSKMEQAQARTEEAQARAADAAAAAAQAGQRGTSPLVYVGIGIGVLVLGTAIYLVAKR